MNIQPKYKRILNSNESKGKDVTPEFMARE